MSRPAIDLYTFELSLSGMCSFMCTSMKLRGLFNWGGRANPGGRAPPSTTFIPLTFETVDEIRSDLYTFGSKGPHLYTLDLGRFEVKRPGKEVEWSRHHKAD